MEGRKKAETMVTCQPSQYTKTDVTHLDNITAHTVQ